MQVLLGKPQAALALAMVVSGCNDGTVDLDSPRSCSPSARSELAWSLAASASWGGSQGVDGSATVVGDDAVFVAGTFAGITDFDPGPEVVSTESDGDASGSGTYVSKLALDGTLLWSAAIRGTRSVGGDVRLALGPDGAVYLAGRTSRPVDLDPGPGEALHEPAEAYTGFVVRLEDDGRYAWSRTWERAQVYGGTPWVLLDGSGGLWATTEGTAERLQPDTGETLFSFAFEPSGGEVLDATMRDDDMLVVARDAVPSTAGTTAAAVEAYDLTGSRAWRYELATPELHAVTTVGRDTIVVGTFAGPSGSIALDPAGADVHTSHGNHDAFATRLDAEGQRRVSVTWGGVGSDTVYAVAPGPDGTAFVAGSFYKTLHRPDGREAFSARDLDAYVMQIGAGGETLGVRTWGGRGEDEALGLAWAPDTGLWITGRFDDDLDASANDEPAEHESAGHSDALLLGLQPGEIADAGQCLDDEEVVACGQETSSRLTGTQLPQHFDACTQSTEGDVLTKSDGNRRCLYTVAEDAEPELFEQCRAAGGGLAGPECKIVYDECVEPCLGNACD